MSRRRLSIPVRRVRRFTSTGNLDPLTVAPVTKSDISFRGAIRLPFNKNRSGNGPGGVPWRTDGDISQTNPRIQQGYTYIGSLDQHAFSCHPEKGDQAHMSDNGGLVYKFTVPESLWASTIGETNAANLPELGPSDMVTDVESAFLDNVTNPGTPLNLMDRAYYETIAGQSLTNNHGVMDLHWDPYWDCILAALALYYNVHGWDLPTLVRTPLDFSLQQAEGPIRIGPVELAVDQTGHLRWRWHTTKQAGWLTIPQSVREAFEATHWLCHQTRQGTKYSTSGDSYLAVSGLPDMSTRFGRGQEIDKSNARWDSFYHYGELAAAPNTNEVGFRQMEPNDPEVALGYDRATREDDRADHKVIMNASGTKMAILSVIALGRYWDTVRDQRNERYFNHYGNNVDPQAGNVDENVNVDGNGDPILDASNTTQPPIGYSLKGDTDLCGINATNHSWHAYKRKPRFRLQHISQLAEVKNGSRSETDVTVSESWEPSELSSLFEGCEEKFVGIGPDWERGEFYACHFGPRGLPAGSGGTAGWNWPILSRWSVN